MAAWAELLGENSAVDRAWTLLVLATSLLALLLAHAHRRRLDRLEATLQRQSLLLGAKLADASGTSRTQDLAPTTSIIVQVSQTNAPGCPVFVASAEAPLGSSPPPALAQGQDASTVINAALSLVYPAEMNGQVGSVRLLPGHYPLATPLVIGRSLALTGSVGVVLEAALPRKPMGPLITVTASDVVLRDLKLDGAAPGTGSPKTGGGAVAGVSIQGPLSRVLVVRALSACRLCIRPRPPRPFADSSWGCSQENVSVSNVSGSAISAVINTQNAPTGGAQTAITVRGCTIDRCGMGGIGLAKRGPLPSPDGSNARAAPLITSSGHMVTGNRISRTGSHASAFTPHPLPRAACSAANPAETRRLWQRVLDGRQHVASGLQPDDACLHLQHYWRVRPRHRNRWELWQRSGGDRRHHGEHYRHGAHACQQEERQCAPALPAHLASVCSLSCLSG